MKTLFLIVLAAAATLAAVTADARSFNNAKYMLGLQPKAHDLYNWSCTEGFCGNWNVKG